MSKPFPYFRFYPRDYLEATRELTLEQRGAYIDIICLQMMLEGLLKDDDDLLSHHLHISKRKWRPIKEALADRGKITIADGMIVNDRCVRELAALMDERKNRSSAADLREKSKRDIAPVQGRTDAEPTPNTQKKTNKINETGTAVVPQSPETEASDVGAHEATAGRAPLNIEPVTNATEKHNEINKTCTTVAPQSAGTEEPATPNTLNGVQARFGSDSTLTHGSVNAEPALNTGENASKINKTCTTTDALRARVSDSDLDKKKVGGDDLAQSHTQANVATPTLHEQIDPDAALRAALTVIRADRQGKPLPEPHAYWSTAEAKMEASKSCEEARMQANVWRDEFGAIELSDSFRESIRKKYSDDVIDNALSRAAGRVNDKSTAFFIATKVREYCSYSKQDADKNNAIVANIGPRKQDTSIIPNRPASVAHLRFNS